jgi:hypothetical protein
LTNSALSGVPFSYTVGKGEVIEAGDLVVTPCRKEKSGSSSSRPNWRMGTEHRRCIPPNSFLVFEIELVSVGQYRPIGALFAKRGFRYLESCLVDSMRLEILETGVRNISNMKIIFIDYVIIQYFGLILFPLR